MKGRWGKATPLVGILEEAWRDGCGAPSDNSFRHRILTERKPNRFAPSLVAPGQGLPGGGIGHGVEPPALFRRKAQPVACGIGNKSRVCLFYRPEEENELLAQAPVQGDPAPGRPFAGGQAVGREPAIE